jgi:phosphoenolpyruvate synthase (EC 2.7.9.2)
LTSPKEIEKIKVGDILVATQTNPDYVPAMKKAAAIVTDKGGRTSHAAIVSRELGIPAVVGTEKATKILKNDQIITVNGQSGEIFLGKVVTVDNKKHFLKTQQKKINTITKIYVNLAQPQEVEKVSQMDVDGVGLLRAEFMIADIGVHPKKMIKEGNEKKFINKLSENLLRFVHAFNPRPVIYRATDFKTNEYRNLIGGKEFEPVEENPMLGFRGASRYLVNKDVFLLELKAIANVWERGYRNLHLMIPFVRLPWELIAIKEIITDFGFLNYPEFKLYIMVEVPSCALMIEEFLKIGVDGVSIGSNDLTMMLLGVDRDNDAVSHLYDERNKVVVETMINVVKAAKKYGVSSSICGQAPSDYPQIVESLVEAGISSLSVNIDAIERTKELVYEIEKRIYKR